MRRALPLIIAAFFTFNTAFAVAPDEQLSDPALEAKAREISKGLRCLVCQNQSIDDSDAELAVDLRRIVRERLSAGDDEAAIYDYVVERYGEYVLLRPRLNSGTLLLWVSPLVLLLLGVGFARYSFRRKDTAATESPITETSDDQQDILNRLRDS